MTAPIFCNSADIYGPEAALIKGGRLRRLRLRVRYGLIRHPSGPVLIDTGYTAHSVDAADRSIALRLYGLALRPRLIPQGQPLAFLARHGLTPGDISRVIVTHFHADHISGLRLFPKARFTASLAAYTRLNAKSSFANTRHGIFPELLPGNFADRLDDVDAAPLTPMGRDIFGDCSVMALDLPGHADGHYGLVFPKARNDGRPLIYATDAQWLNSALEPAQRPRLLPHLIAEDAREMDRSCDLLNHLRSLDAEVVLCHDPAPTSYDEAQL